MLASAKRRRTAILTHAEKQKWDIAHLIVARVGLVSGIRPPVEPLHLKMAEDIIAAFPMIVDEGVDKELIAATLRKEIARLDHDAYLQTAAAKANQQEIARLTRLQHRMWIWLLVALGVGVAIGVLFTISI